MDEMYIERNIEKIGVQKIELTSEEIEQAGKIYTLKQKNQDTEYYRQELIKMLTNEYSEEFANYFVKNENDFFEQLAEVCFGNQNTIDNYGIYFVYDLEKGSEEEIMQIYNEWKGKENVCENK